MAVKSIKTKNLVWHNVLELDSDSLQWLKKEFNFHSLAIKDCQGDLQHPKVDYYKGYVFLVVHFPEIDHKNNIIRTLEVDIFVGKNFVITIQKQKNKSLNNIFYRLTTNIYARNYFMSEGSAFFLYRILDEMYRKFSTVTRYVYAKIDETERQIFGDETTASIKRLADLRRMVLKLRLMLDPQKVVISSLQRAKVDFFPPEIELYFEDISDFFEKIWAILENQKDLVDGLYDTNESMLSYRMNRVIQVLTIFSVAMLPLTLLTGFYGMNIPLPWANHPLVVYSIFVLLILAIIGVIVYYRRRNII